MAISLHHSLAGFQPQTSTRFDFDQSVEDSFFPPSKVMNGGVVTVAEFSRARANSMFLRNPCGKRVMGLNLERRNRSGWVSHKLDGPELSQRQQGVGVGVVAKNSGPSSKESKSVMIDPVEAKRLAALEMAKLRAEILFQKNRRVEAINGGWAVLGLTAGIVVEGLTGRGIVVQLQSYWILLAQFLDRIGSSSS